MSNFTKLEILSEHIFGYISRRVFTTTGIPLVSKGKFKFAYVKELDSQVMRANSTHNGHDIKFLVHLDNDKVLEIEKYEDYYIGELNKVAEFIISYILNGYKYKEGE